jgi:hypothetical protein
VKPDLRRESLRVRRRQDTVARRAPVPVDTPMTLECDGGSRHLLKRGDALICEARPATLALQAPGPQKRATAERLSAGV